jgi:hypothetical protein
MAAITSFPDEFPELRGLSMGDVAFPFGFKLVVESDGSKYLVGHSKEEHQAILDKNPGISATCSLVNNYACVGVCEQFGQQCTLKKNGNSYYCVCIFPK